MGGSFPSPPCTMTFAGDLGSCFRAVRPCVQLPHSSIPLCLLSQAVGIPGEVMWPTCPTQVPCSPLQAGAGSGSRPWKKGPRPRANQPPVGSAHCLPGPSALLGGGRDGVRREARRERQKRRKGDRSRGRERGRKKDQVREEMKGRRERPRLRGRHRDRGGEGREMAWAQGALVPWGPDHRACWNGGLGGQCRVGSLRAVTLHK